MLGDIMTLARRMLRTICIGALASFVNIPTPRADETAQQAAAESLVKSFIGLCVLNVPNLDRVEATARISSWKEIKGDALKLIGPQDPSNESKAWMVKGAATTTFALAISRGMLNGKRISACSVGDPYAPMLPIRSALEKFLQLQKPISQDISGGQQNVVWSTNSGMGDLLIYLLDATPMNENGITITATVND